MTSYFEFFERKDLRSTATAAIASRDEKIAALTARVKELESK